MKNQLKKNTKNWMYGILGGVILLTAAIILLVQGKQAGVDPPSTKENIATESNASGPKLLTMDMGDSDEFYKAPPDKRIILSFGDGRYDITDDVEMWMFGEPIVNLPSVLTKMGLSFTTTPPKGYKKMEGYEIYGPGEDPDISMRQPCFAIDEDGDYVTYTINSRQVRDQDGLQSSMAYPCTLTEEGTLLISAAYLPWCDENGLVGIGSASFTYTESEIEVSIEASTRKAGHKNDEQERQEEEGGKEDEPVEEMESETSE